MRPHFSARAPTNNVRNTGRAGTSIPTGPTVPSQPGDSVYDRIGRGDYGPVKPHIAVPPKSTPTKPSVPVPGSQEAIDAYIAKKASAKERFDAEHGGRIKRPEDVFDKDTMTPPFANLFFGGTDSYTADEAPVLPLLDLGAIRDFVAKPSGPEWDGLKSTVEFRNRVRGVVNSDLKKLWGLLKQKHGDGVNLSRVHTSIVDMEGSNFVCESSPMDAGDDAKADSMAKDELSKQGMFGVFKSIVELGGSPTDDIPLSDAEMVKAEDSMLKAEGEDTGFSGFMGQLGNLRQIAKGPEDLTKIRDDLYDSFSVSGHDDIQSVIGVLAVLINEYPGYAKKHGWDVSDRNSEKHMTFAYGMLLGAVRAYQANTASGETFLGSHKNRASPVSTGAPKVPKGDYYFIAFLMFAMAVISFLSHRATGSPGNIRINSVNSSRDLDAIATAAQENIQGVDRPNLFADDPLPNFATNEEAEAEALRIFDAAMPNVKQSAENVLAAEKGLCEFIEAEGIPVEQMNADPVLISDYVGKRVMSPRSTPGTLGWHGHRLQSERHVASAELTDALHRVGEVMMRRPDGRENWTVTQQLANGILNVPEPRTIFDVMSDPRSIINAVSDSFRSYDAMHWTHRFGMQSRVASMAGDWMPEWFNATGNEPDPRDEIDRIMTRDSAGIIHLLFSDIAEIATFTVIREALHLMINSVGGAVHAVSGDGVLASRVLPAFLAIPGREKAGVVWMLTEAVFRGVELMHTELRLRRMWDLFSRLIFAIVVNTADAHTFGVFGLSAWSAGSYDLMRLGLLVYGVQKGKNLKGFFMEMMHVATPISPSVLLSATVLVDAADRPALPHERLLTLASNIVFAGTLKGAASGARIARYHCGSEWTSVIALSNIFSRAESDLHTQLHGKDEAVASRPVVVFNMNTASSWEIIKKLFRDYVIDTTHGKVWSIKRFLRSLYSMSRPMNFHTIIRQATSELNRRGGRAMAAQFLYRVGSIAMAYWMYTIVSAGTLAVQDAVSNRVVIPSDRLFNISRNGTAVDVRYGSMSPLEQFKVVPMMQWVQAPSSGASSVERVTKAFECSRDQPHRIAMECFSRLTNEDRSLANSWKIRAEGLSGSLLAMSTWPSNVTTAAVKLVAEAPYRDQYSPVEDPWSWSAFPVSGVPRDVDYAGSVIKRSHPFIKTIKAPGTSPIPGSAPYSEGKGIHGLASVLFKGAKLPAVWINWKEMLFEPETTLFPEAMSENVAYILWQVIRTQYPGEEEKAFSSDHYIRQVIDMIVEHRGQDRIEHHFTFGGST